GESSLPGTQGHFLLGTGLAASRRILRRAKAPAHERSGRVAPGDCSPRATRPGTRGHFQPFTSLNRERGALSSRSIRDEKSGRDEKKWREPKNDFFASRCQI